MQIARLFARKGSPVSLGSVLLISSCILCALPLFYVLSSELFYQLPQTLALVFTFLGLSAWIESKLRGLSKPWLAAGSFLVACTLGCRPQFALSALLAVPLFAPEIAHLWIEGRASSKGLRAEIHTWLCALLPFAVVFIPLFAYNTARFGSPLDFGSNYNLTGYDMTHSSFPLTQMLPLTFLYFFQPPNLSTTFPFLLPTHQEMSTWLPMQASYGGYFALIAPFALVVAGWGSCKRVLRKRQLNMLCVSLAVIALGIYAINTHLVGFDIRYMLDFGWAIMLVAALCILAFDSYRVKSNDRGAGSNKHKRHLTCEAASTQLNPLRVRSRCVLGWVNVGLVLSCLGIFFYIFAVRNPGNDQLWWSVYSWFVFM